MDDITLYKYRCFGDENHLRLLTEGEIFLSSPRHFDDDLDCAIPVRLDLGDARETVELFASEVKRRSPDIGGEEAVRKAQEYLDDKELTSEEALDDVEQINRKISEEMFGVCSLSRNPNSSRMWQYYACDHTGFCVGLDWDRMGASARRIRKEGKRVDAFPVEYTDEVPVLDVFVYDAVEIVMKHLTTKLDHLHYEEEYRVVGLDLPDTALQMGQEVISSIALGARVAKENAERVREIVNGINHDVPIYKATTSSVKASGSRVKFREL